jgi:acyl-CoA dehydrogenase
MLILMLSLVLLLALCGLVCVILLTPPLRRVLISRHIFRVFQKLKPTISKTEREALESGTVSFEGEIFTGRFDVEKLLGLPQVKLSAEEQAFLDGPVQELCGLVDDWEVSQRNDLPANAWSFLKEKGFFGMIIPRRYGGKEFSAWAQSCVVVKTGSRCAPLAVTIAVPNSLGPAELILKYGTESQKELYLPRLARGDEIPCFALTGIWAGSDAASIPDTGVVCYGTWEGKKTLGIKLNWEKRYITLAPIATLIGLAFKMLDPDHLLGDVEDLGITCALVPTNLTGITIGRRHNPMHVAFMNGPTQGKDVFVPLEQIIGGREMAGHGWRMLMECLSAGRAITLPSGGAGGGCLAALYSGAYARIREQFGLPLSHLEGILEPLAQLASNAYTNTSALRFTIGAIDAGQQPPVASAIIKYHTTERLRKSVSAAMDIHGGKGICIGPRNYLNGLYQVVPIDITVEGANILTRNVIIFGQGALRCHPYMHAEIQAAENHNLVAFDHAIFAHVRYAMANSVRSWTSGVAGRFGSSRDQDLSHLIRAISRLSSAFCLTTDVAALTLGGSLKRKERISARLGDVLSLTYLACANVKRYHDDGKPNEDFPLLNFACRELVFEAELALDECCRNLPNRLAAWLLRRAIFPLGRLYSPPSDDLARQSASLLTSPGPTRDRLRRHLYHADLPNCSLALLENALTQIHACESLYQLLHESKKSGAATGMNILALANDALAKGLIKQDDLLKLRAAEQVRLQVIVVDDFAADNQTHIQPTAPQVVSS